MPERPSPSNLGSGAPLRGELFRHTSRVVILLSLGTNKRLIFSQLLRLTGLSKGSLGHHLRQLESAGFVSLREVFTVSGPRVVVSITPAGQEACDLLRRELVRLVREEPFSQILLGPAAGPS